MIPQSGSLFPSAQNGGQNLHISQSSEVSDHCCPFALSHDDQKYSRKCEHTHGRSCTKCEQLSSVLGLISNAATIAEYESEDQKDEVQYLVNQDRARKVVMDNLEKDEALLERDWAMKFLPMQYRESKSKWFAKRGLSWHVGVVSMKAYQNDYQNFTIVHVFDNATQDALTSTSILQDTINHINKENKKIKTLSLRSDNAGCFHSSYSLTTIPMINKKSLIKIKRVDFSDPQGEKCICDRKAAHIKGHIKRYVNEGNNVVTADDFRKAVATMSNKDPVVPDEPVIETSHLLNKGWGLKGKREVKRFSVEQKDFLVQKFNQGEVTGHKCEPEEVGNEMRTAKNKDGKRIFKCCDFLTPTQIAALKKRQNANTAFQEEDLQAEEVTNEICNAFDSVALQ
ncbi:unnamed protein product [Mytilus coruscus]|uniref:Uncharacterized protein n=1 Tax=Mytilus coruscus TaxID=42192 RepID=A0A6J8D9J7_MYTCO|nr:unnamed protein product [Mytilus coruscus]